MLPLLCAAAIFNHPSFLDEVLNSDTLLPAAYVWDLIHHHKAWQWFQFPRIPSLFPDLLVYGLVQWASGDWRWGHFAYGCFALLALCALSAAIIAQIAACNLVRAGQSFLLLALPLLGFEMLATGGGEAGLHLLILYPVSHGGPFLFGLAILLCAGAGSQTPGFARMALVALLVALGIWSDRLLLLVTVLPLACEFALRRRARDLCCIALLAAAAALGWWPLDSLLLREPDLRIIWRDVPDHAWQMLRSPFFPLGAEAPVTILLGLFLPLAWLVRWRPLHWRACLAPDHRWWRMAMIGLSLSMVATSLVYEDVPSYRYLSPLLWWPLIFCAAALARRLPAGPAPALLLGMGGILSVAAYATDGWQAPKILTARDPLVQCLEEARRNHGLRAGLGEYWFARYAEAMSDWRLQLDQVTVAGAAYLWGNDPFWYFRDIQQGERPVERNFLLMVSHPDSETLMLRYGPTLGQKRLNAFLGFDPELMLARYGAPDRQLNCPASSGSSRMRGESVSIWIYDDPDALQERMLVASPFLPAEMLRRREKVTLSAGLLSAADPGAHHDQKLFAHGQAGSHIASFGPYLTLPAGSYRFGLDYRLASDDHAEPNRWAVTIEGGRKILAEGPLPSTATRGASLWAEFGLEKESQGVEFLTILPGSAEIAISALTIEPAP